MAMNPNPSASLEDQVLELRTRVCQLEEALCRQGILSVSEEAALPLAAAEAAASTSEPIPEIPTQDWQTASPSEPLLMPAEPPRFGVSADDSGEKRRSLESRIGSQWFNRIGILAVLIAMAWFLKMAIDNQWIGPLGRVLIGLLAGAGLIAWSEHIRRRGYTAFSYSLKALGSGILYLSLWAAFSVYQLIPGSAAFAAMIAVTAFNGFMAWVEDAELLALYAIAGGLSTPLLVSTGENHEVTLFSYILLLDLAVLVLVALRPWSRLLFGAFAGTVFFMAGWWFSWFSQDQAERTAIFLALYFLVFAFAPRLVRLEEGDAGRSSGWDNLALVVSPITNAALGFLGFWALLEITNHRGAESWLAVAFAGFYLLLRELPEKGRLHASPLVLSELHLAAAVVFLTIAIPLKAHGRWLTVGWLAEGAALLWVARPVWSVLLRVLSLLCLLLGLVALLIHDPAAGSTPFLNQRFATYCAAIAAFAFVAWLAYNGPKDEAIEPVLRWPMVAGAAVLIVNALILVAIGCEINYFWWLLKWRGETSLLHEYKIYAQFTYSAFFMLFGAVLLTVGFWRRSAFLRWQALVLVAATIGKVFLIDIHELAEGYRILSFLGLGALLLGVSFIYQRDLLSLRGHGGQTG
jgi:uncharacterized membrane protein